MITLACVSLGQFAVVNLKKGIFMFYYSALSIRYNKVKQILSVFQCVGVTAVLPFCLSA